MFKEISTKERQASPPRDNQGEHLKARLGLAAASAVGLTVMVTGLISRNVEMAETSVVLGVTSAMIYIGVFRNDMKERKERELKQKKDEPKWELVGREWELKDEIRGK